MENNASQNTHSPAKHIKPVWGMIIVAVVAAVLGGIVTYAAFSGEMQDDLYSISFTSPIQIHQNTKALSDLLWQRDGCAKQTKLSAECAALQQPIQSAKSK